MNNIQIELLSDQKNYEYEGIYRSILHDDTLTYREKERKLAEKREELMALREEVRVLKLEKDRIRHMHKSGTASPDDTREFKKAFKYAFLTSIASSPKTLDEAIAEVLSEVFNPGVNVDTYVRTLSGRYFYFSDLSDENSLIHLTARALRYLENMDNYYRGR